MTRDAHIIPFFTQLFYSHILFYFPIILSSLNPLFSHYSLHEREVFPSVQWVGGRSLLAAKKVGGWLTSTLHFLHTGRSESVGAQRRSNRDGGSNSLDVDDNAVRTFSHRTTRQLCQWARTRAQVLRMHCAGTLQHKLHNHIGTWMIT